jgi:phosphohistidine phosphatase
MKLHLIRHAKTDQNSATGKDYDRMFLPRGKRQSHTLYKYLMEKQLPLVQVFCSSAKRTIQTWEGIENAIMSKTVFYKEEWYMCDLKYYLRSIWTTDRREDIVIIGHNFALSDLVNYFLDSHFILGTSEYFCIEFDVDAWSETSKGLGKLIDRFRPDDL